MPPSDLPNLRCCFSFRCLSATCRTWSLTLPLQIHFSITTALALLPSIEPYLFHSANILLSTFCYSISVSLYIQSSLVPTMAASTFAMAGSTSCLDLASKSAFVSSPCNVVQATPMARSAAARVGAIRASSNDTEGRVARREALAGILAAGAALGFSSQASAALNPIAGAKSKAGEAAQGAKDIASSNPLGGIEGAVDEASSGIKRRLDGLFGKNKPYPAANKQVTGKGAIADAKGRVDNFFGKSQNPLATNIEKASKETASGLGTVTGPNSASARAGKEFLGQDSTRVDEATARVNAGAEKLQNKALQAFDDAKGTVAAGKDAAPDVSVPTPGSDVFQSLGSKLAGVKGDFASKAEEAKSALPGQ